MADEREFNVTIVNEDGVFWGEVVELPGTFASGETMEELVEALTEAITLVSPVRAPRRRVMRPSPPMRVARVDSARLTLV